MSIKRLVHGSLRLMNYEFLSVCKASKFYSWEKLVAFQANASIMYYFIMNLIFAAEKFASHDMTCQVCIFDLGCS